MKIKRTELEDFLGEMYVLTEKSEMSRILLEVTKAELQKRLQVFYKKYLADVKQKVKAMNDALRVLENLGNDSPIKHNDLTLLATQIKEIYVNIDQTEASFKDVFEF